MKVARDIITPILERNKSIHFLVNKAITDTEALIEMMGRRDADPDINDIVVKLEGALASLNEHPNRNHEYACGAVFDVTLSVTRRVFARGNNEAVLLARHSLKNDDDDGEVVLDSLECKEIEIIPTSDLHDCVSSWGEHEAQTKKRKRGL